jgi:hypothetical protein
MEAAPRIASFLFLSCHVLSLLIVTTLLLTDYYDVPELPDSNRAPEITEPHDPSPSSLSTSSPPPIPAAHRMHVTLAKADATLQLPR